jgi:hypothetical protein
MQFRALTVAVGFAITAAVTMAGCASLGSSRSATEVVLERAQSRWDALLKRDWASAYGYLSSGYRATVPLDRYGSQFGGPMQWEAAKAQGAECEESRCVVMVEITFKLLLPGHRDRTSSTFVEEVWLLEEGQWYKFEKL